MSTEVKQEGEFKLKKKKVTPKKLNKKNHQNSDRDALPEKMAYLLKQTSIDFVNVI